MSTQQYFGKSLYIGVDFDGTVVTHNYPKVGEDIGAVPVLLEMVAAGHKLILNTMRSKETLDDAVKWFKKHNIPLHGANKNPTQETWTTSPKVYAHLYIDDAALGCPIKFDTNISDSPFVDWDSAYRILKDKGVI